MRRAARLMNFPLVKLLLKYGANIETCLSYVRFIRSHCVMIFQCCINEWAEGVIYALEIESQKPSLDLSKLECLHQFLKLRTDRCAITETFITAVRMLIKRGKNIEKSFGLNHAGFKLDTVDKKGFTAFELLCVRSDFCKYDAKAALKLRQLAENEGYSTRESPLQKCTNCGDWYRQHQAKECLYHTGTQIFNNYRTCCENRTRGCAKRAHEAAVPPWKRYLWNQ